MSNFPNPVTPEKQISTDKFNGYLEMYRAHLAKVNYPISVQLLHLPL
ncbi:hypothetical protein [Victivallis sp. Marseille-Q1083]|nr:hypothetical protein [Victivallis sp. Marseille-Q1083]